jgi:FKBP-type peptidyl-prolyl cis-trans isomerase FklB
MKTFKKITVIALIGTIVSCKSYSGDVKSLETVSDSVSYAIGLNMSTQFKSNFKEVNKDAFMQGFRNGSDSINLLISEKDVQKVISSYFQKKQQEEMKGQQSKAVKEAEAKFGEVKKEGEAFLAENSAKEGVVTTESGLQYVILKEGKGENPGATSKVKLHYHGMLLDGTVFDSSVDRNEPIEMGVNQFVKGFSEGLQVMNVGSKYRFFIPQELAYGATPREGVIKPFMALIFEVELLEIK